RGCCAPPASFHAPHAGAAPARVYALSLHDALPICQGKASFQLETADASGKRVIELDKVSFGWPGQPPLIRELTTHVLRGDRIGRSEEHTPERQSREKRACRLPLEQKKSSAGSRGAI